MTAERWQRIEQLYHAALAHDGEERRAFLRASCEGDPSLLQEVESLLAHEQTSEKFLGVPAVEVAAAGLTDAAHPLLGQGLGAYQVQALLGVGGMGASSSTRASGLSVRRTCYSMWGAIKR